MKIVIFLLLIYVTLLAEVKYEFSGNVELTNDYTSLNMSDNKKYSGDINILDLVVNNDIMFDTGRLAISPGVYYTSASTYNSVIKGNVDNIEAVYFNELYYTQSIVNNVTFSVGLFPFRKGTLYEQSFNGKRLGNGIFDINDVTMEGAILTLKPCDNNTLSLGKINFDKYFKSFYDFNKGSNKISYDSYDGSGGYFLIDKNNYGKLYTEFNYYNIDQYVNNSKIITSDIYGFAFIYDDSEDSGNTYYGSLVFTNSKGNNVFLSPIDNVPIKTDEYYFDDFKTHGYSYTLGFKKEFDNVIFNRDMVAGIEYMYKSPGYHSLAAGKPISPFSYADIGTVINANIGLHIDKNNLVKIRYCHYDSNGKSTLIGLTPEAGDVNNISNSIKTANSFMLQWYIDF